MSLSLCLCLSVSLSLCFCLCLPLSPFGFVSTLAIVKTRIVGTRVTEPLVLNTFLTLPLSFAFQSDFLLLLLKPSRIFSFLYISLFILFFHSFVHCSSFILLFVFCFVLVLFVCCVCCCCCCFFSSSFFLLFLGVGWRVGGGGNYVLN